MYFRWLLFVSFAVLSITGFAQLQDSLKRNYQNAVKARDLVAECFYLSELGKLYYSTSRTDSARLYYNDAIQIARKVKNDTMVASNLNDLGNIYKDKGNLDSAITCYLEALKIFERLSLKIEIAYARTNLARVYKDIGVYELAQEMALSAEIIFLEFPKDPNALVCFNTIGSISSKLKEYKRALKYYHKALDGWRKSGELSKQASALNNIGNVFMNMDRNDSALYAYLRSLEIRKHEGQTKSVATTLNNLGEVSIKLGKLKDAKNYLDESLEIKKEIGDKLGQIITLNNLANYFIQLPDTKSATQYLNDASRLEKSIGGVLDERKKNLELRIQLNRKAKNFKEASRLYEELLAVKDSLLDRDKAVALAGMQIGYEIDKKEQQIDVLNIRNNMQELTIDNRELWIATLAIAVLVILISLLFYFLSYVNAKRHRESVELLMKELHHRVKNNLQVLSSVLSLQSQALTDENALLSVKSTESRINAMALIHRKLYSDDRNTIVSTRGYFRELIEFLMSSYGYHENNLTLEADIDEIELDVDKAIPLGLIMNELISNAFKHAYVNKANARLVIQVKKRDNVLAASIRDNGSGETVPLGDETKFGMRMVNILVRDLKGDFNTSINHGTEHRITFPLA